LKFYCEEPQKVLSALQSSSKGLSDAEAQARLTENGPNRLTQAPGKSLIRRFAEQLADPMILVLLGAALISGILAFVESESFADVIIILAVVMVNAVLGVFQESKAEKAIEALQELSGSSAKVYRSGNLRVISADALTVGDVILLEAGDAVPADARILEGAGLKTEESALTGESLPVDKDASPLTPPESGDIPLGDRKNMVYTGSSVVYGRATAVVTAIGMDTEMGKIAGALQGVSEEVTPLQRKLKELSRILTRVVLGISAIIFIVRLLTFGEFSLEPILDSFMVAVSLAVAAIPEGLAAVVTVVLSIGVTNMSHRNAIIRRLTAVETLGCAQIICSDKTGTLTQNRMTVVGSFGGNEKDIATAMALCSDAEVDEKGEVTGEPTEAALVAWAHRLGKDKNVLKVKLPRVGEAPFDSLRKMMTTLHNSSEGVLQFTKGAPDIILEHCSFVLENGEVIPLTDELRHKFLKSNKEMADRALRVLAVAMRTHPALPGDLSPLNLEKDMVLIGLCGMIDPIRPEVKTAIEECRKAGIRPIMITGDHVDTAAAIARELGILTDGYRAVSGAQLDQMDDETFEREFKTISVYARVQPEHKTRIVSAWKKDGMITAMTGDGVNDAPSIKTADIGVGMGITGTDVTKNVADMVLADDNFATIVGAVDEGRRIYANIRKAIQFLLGSNMGEVLCIFLATLMGFTVLKPVHLLWINLATDCFPALALGMEKAEPGIMSRPPRDPKEGIFADGLGFRVVWQGGMVAALTLISYLIGSHASLTDSAQGMTMAFLTMSFAEIFHSLNMRSLKDSIFTLPSQNRLLLISAFSSLLLTLLVTELPFLAGAFSLSGISLGQTLIALLLGLSVIPIVELSKWFGHRFGKK